jgi:2-oxoglutarate ferredoxin oxidoreductase subunit beta
VFRNFERPVYGDAIAAQMQRARERLGPGDLRALLHGGDTWTVS